MSRPPARVVPGPALALAFASAVVLALGGAAGAAAQTGGGAAAPAAAPRLSVELRPEHATVGDRVEATLTLRLEGLSPDGEPRFPDWRRSWGEVEVHDAGKPAREAGDGGETVYRQRLVLTPFKVGKLPLPPVAVAVPLASGTVSVETPADLALDVTTVLPPGDRQPPPRPPAPPRRLPIGARFWWTAAGFTAACLAAAAGLLLRRRRAASATPPVPLLAPLAELEAALSQAAAEPSTEVAHTRLSLALRRYLGRSFGFPAAERTTSEIQRSLRRHLPPELVRHAAGLLADCDLVKFARLEVGRGTLETRVEAARELGRTIEARLHPAAPVELEATA